MIKTNKNKNKKPKQKSKNTGIYLFFYNNNIMTSSFLLYAVIFIIILFVYLHVYYHLKVSNDLELFEIYDATTKTAFEEVCNLRQPSVFSNIDNELVNTITANIQMATLLTKYGDFNIQVRNGDAEEYASVPFHVAQKLMLTASPSATTTSAHQQQWHTERNADFVKETCIFKTINDRILTPPLCSTREYDIMFGTPGTVTPLRYNINHRNFYVCTQGVVYVKMIPPKYSEYLDPVADYDMFEFRSAHSPNQVASPSVKALDIALSPGKILYIPPYWWHSFQYSENTIVVAFKYCSYMNQLAHTPQYLMCFLQRNNIRTRFTRRDSTPASDRIEAAVDIADPDETEFRRQPVVLPEPPSILPPPQHQEQQSISPSNPEEEEKNTAKLTKKVEQQENKQFEQTENQEEPINQEQTQEEPEKQEKSEKPEQISLTIDE